MKEEMAMFLQTEHHKLSNYIRKRVKPSYGISAEDILQEVALHLFNRVDFTTPLENLTAYVYRAIRNKIIDIIRAKRSSRNLSREDDSERIIENTGDEKADIMKNFERRELQEHFFAALYSLAPEQQEIWIATELEGKSFREMSEQSGVPLGTLLARKKRANDRLKELLADFYQSIKE